MLPLEVQSHSSHRLKHTHKTDHWCLSKNTENAIGFPPVRMALGSWLLLLVSSAEECYSITAAQHLLRDVFLHQRWNWVFHLQTLHNVKTFPSAPDYLVARNRFPNPLLTYLPGTLVRLSSQSRELTSWDGKSVMTFIINASFHFHFNHVEAPTSEISLNYFRIYCMKNLGYLLVSIHQKLGKVYTRHEMSLWNFTNGLMMLINIWGKPEKKKVGCVLDSLLRTC